MKWRKMPCKYLICFYLQGINFEKIANNAENASQVIDSPYVTRPKKSQRLQMMKICLASY